eukprot:CAMPEP_0170592492 /NCGR_PEP_ID=MMETSP0224-20130122/12951_1 /TAXON_ID=285029 /ORGANISM="Togula jolla, Strain CCCM 725" /LENGTH=133 /DNA_ID=CAMNT_0010916397 /DNA_START=601 /DNA_END=1003 /DNA_ORIENTATION=-
MHHQDELSGEPKFRTAEDLVAFEDVHQVSCVVCVQTETQEDGIGVRENMALYPGSRTCWICYEEGLCSPEVVVPGRVGIHVMLQKVVPEPTLTGKAYGIETEVRVPQALGLMDPVVTKSPINVDVMPKANAAT